MLLVGELEGLFRLHSLTLFEIQVPLAGSPSLVGAISPPRGLTPNSQKWLDYAVWPLAKPLDETKCQAM